MGSPFSGCSFNFVNPPAPYSSQKCPEPQTCRPKSVPTIVFRDPIMGTQIRQKLVENWKTTVSGQNFQLQILDKLEFGAFLNAVRGRRVRNLNYKILISTMSLVVALRLKPVFWFLSLTARLNLLRRASPANFDQQNSLWSIFGGRS